MYTTRATVYTCTYVHLDLRFGGQPGLLQTPNPAEFKLAQDQQRARRRPPTAKAKVARRSRLVAGQLVAILTRFANAFPTVRTHCPIASIVSTKVFKVSTLSIEHFLLHMNTVIDTPLYLPHLLDPSYRDPI